MGCRRPIRDDEIARLTALGMAVSSARRRAGLTQPQLAEWAELSVRGLAFIEAGHRRTRESTLDRIGAGIAWAEIERGLGRPLTDGEVVDLGEDVAMRVDDLLEHWLTVVGFALAPESAFADRVDRRRARRWRKRARGQQRAVKRVLMDEYDHDGYDAARTRRSPDGMSVRAPLAT